MFWSGRNMLRVAALLAFTMASFSAVVLAAKPAPPPPPPPPISFDIHLLGIYEQPVDVNDAGDIVLGLQAVLFAGNTTATPVGDLPHEPQWSIFRVFRINDNWQIACRATYVGETDEQAGLTQGSDYIGVLNLLDGVFTRYFATIPGSALQIEGINNSGVICGQFAPSTQGAYYQALTAGPEENSGMHFLFPGDAGVLRSWGMAINDAGQVAGRRGNYGFRWTPASDVGGEVTLMLPGKAQDGRNVTDFSVAADINASGDLAVYASGPASVKGFGSSGDKACRYEDGSGLIQLSTRDSLGTGITASGDVLGYFDWSSPREHFLHLKASNTLVSLKTTGVVQGSAGDVNRWKNETAYLNGINNSRVIVGHFSNDQQAFVLVPRSN